MKSLIMITYLTALLALVSVFTGCASDMQPEDPYTVEVEDGQIDAGTDFALPCEDVVEPETSCVKLQSGKVVCVADSLIAIVYANGDVPQIVGVCR